MTDERVDMPPLERIFGRGKDLVATNIGVPRHPFILAIERQRRASADAGLAHMTMDEIDAEITASRAERSGDVTRSGTAPRSR
jgi:hypothetical protein